MNAREATTVLTNTKSEATIVKKVSHLSLRTCAAGLLILTSCVSNEDPKASSAQPRAAAEQSAEIGPRYAPANPYLADSVLPIGHVNSAQSTGVNQAGPSGPTENLSREGGGLTYSHMGPGHFGLAISPPYLDGKRVIWSNGAERISKLDYETLEVIDEFFLEDSSIYIRNGGGISAEQAEADFAALDKLPKVAGSGMMTLKASMPYAKNYMAGGTAGVYYLLSADNVLYVGGAKSIIAYADDDPTNRQSTIGIKNEWQKPEGITGSFNSMNMTHDGWICGTTEEGWVVLVRPDLSDYKAIQLTGAEVAPLWNDHAEKVFGKRAGSAAWVRNGAAIDEDGGIYVPSLQHVHKIVWDGETLSNDEADGAWVASYSNDGPYNAVFKDVIDPVTGEAYTATFENVNVGSGATASLMGFGDEDPFVVITDGDEVMNMVLLWRNEIPEDWDQLTQAPSRRIAGMLRADIGNDEAVSVQTEQSVVVGGYGAFVVNNSPASKPLPKAPNGLYVGHAGHHPDFMPHGTQKFEWDPQARQLKEAWVNQISSINNVPLVSNGANLVYTMGARDGEWTLEAIEWDTGKPAFHFTVGSSRYNTVYSGLLMDGEGRLIHSTFHGILRYERLPKR